MSMRVGHRPSNRAESWSGLVLTVVIHVAAIWGLLQFGAVRRAIVDTAPIMVNFITPPVDEPPKPQPATPTSKPLREPPEPAPVLTTRAQESPSPIVAPPAPRAPELPPIDAAPATAVVPPNFSAAYLNNPKPAYPAISRRMREEGKVLLRVLVSAEGNPEKVELQTSSGSSRLDQAATEAVRAWRFIPARQAGNAVSAWVIVPISFSLEG